jgi:hypothetical protein
MFWRHALSGDDVALSFQTEALGSQEDERRRSVEKDRMAEEADMQSVMRIGACARVIALSR